MQTDIDVIKIFINKNIDVDLSLKFDSQGLRTQRKLQHIFSKKFSDPRQQKIFEIVLDHAERAERACPQSGIQLLKNLANQKSSDVDTPANKSQVLDSLKCLRLSKFSTSILTSIIDFCNSDSKIKLSKSSNDKSYVEISDNYQFEALPLIKPKRLQEKFCKVFAIDGFVENVSELHHLFHYFSTQEKETPFVIFCRGMSDDVINTISVNNARNSLSCYAYKVNFDIENVNTLVDIAVVCGIDVTSNLKGDLISSVKTENVPSIEKFSHTKSGVLFKCKDAKKRVATHITNLKRKLESCNEIEKDFIYKRMRNLSSNSIEISIADDINYFARTQEIDEGIRVILSVMNKSFLTHQTSQLYYRTLMITLESISTIV